MTTEPAAKPSIQEELKRLLPEPTAQMAWLALGVVFLWFHWESFRNLWAAWKQEDYGHGYFVVPFSLFLLWWRRDMILSHALKGSWWGLVFFGLWALMRWAAVYFNYLSVPEYAMLPFFAGVALLVGGWRALLWAWPAIFFLFFMIPLPGALQGLVSQQLQGLAARLSLIVIQTIGIPAVGQGHVLQLSDAPEPLDVAQACSGLRMMMLFCAICIGAALIVRKPLWERLLIVASAAPIAVISNVIRIVLTGVVTEIARAWPSLITYENAMHYTHNWAGYLMMPIGLLLLLGEMWLLSKLLIPPPPDRPLMAGMVTGAGTLGTTERVLRRRRN
jgi:exosortase